MTLRRTVIPFVIAMLIGAVGPLAAANASKTTPASFTRHTYPASGVAGARDYWLYVPATAHRLHAAPPVVVFLHGCNQTAEQAAVATRLNQFADRDGFIAVYPQENVTTPLSAPLADGNGVGCWNWFLPDDQVRGQGEPAAIVGITNEVVRTLHADRSRVYIEGISAGGAMSVILAANYPDVYAAAGILAGCSYRTCSDVSGEFAYAAMGPRARTVPMFIENGTADTLNPYAQSQVLAGSWLGVDDLVDDGSLNGTVSRQPAAVDSYETDQAPQPGSGDPCVHNNSFTCPGGVVGFQGSYPYTVERYADAQACDVLELWIIHGMEHAQPDAPAGEPYTDPLGPDITAASLTFFSQHPMNLGCPTVAQLRNLGG